MRRRLSALLVLLAALAAGPALADSPPPARPHPMRGFQLDGQSTVIWQNLFPFHSPYQGPHSLISTREAETTHTYTLFLGWRAGDFEGYVNPELAAGSGLSGGVGLAAFTNGELVRNPALSNAPYLARYFVRWTIPTGRGRETVEDAPNQIAGRRPMDRLVVSVGRLASTDLFDVNRYANSPRTQFMNWALINDAAYDYAANTRGYSDGAALEWIHPGWAVRIGSFRMPTVANGQVLAGDMIHNRGDQAEVELHPGPMVVRLLGYRNLAHMGSYRAAVALAALTGETPDVTAVEKEGAVKWGMGLNLEYPLADGGDTGLFARAGFNDGATEDFAFTEAEQHLSVGAQISGAHWGRPADRVGVALVNDNLSAAHRAYLEAGGLGFQLGDGRLRYGPEQVLEAYYAWQINRPFSISLDAQALRNPGYNHDRGPVLVPSLRLHVDF